MKIHRMVTIVAGLVLPWSIAWSQGGSIDPQCRNGTLAERVTQDACQKAFDLFAFTAPQLGTALAGGNAVSGEHSALGPGHFTIGIRANVVGARLPQVEARSPVITGAVASDYGVKETAIPLPALDGAVGVFGGIPVGVTRTLGADVLLNVSYIPGFSSGGVDVSLPSGALKLGFGARVSVMQETALTPGVSFTWLRRDLPTVTVTGSPGTDELRVEDLQARTSAWRGVIGKRFGLVALTAGFGQDRYETSALVRVRVTRAGLTTSAGPIAVEQDLTRDNAFGSVALNLVMVSIVAEGGRASGGRVATYNTFGGDRADDPVGYGSLGVRLRW